MSEHTPGEWIADENGETVWVKKFQGEHVDHWAEICQVDELPEQEANARLIAAAPSLLAAPRLRETQPALEGMAI